jgi:hypothetical protein
MSYDTEGIEAVKETSWCADRRHLTVWRASRIFFKTYLKQAML